MDGPAPTILDTSVLINFLVVERVGHLASLSKRQFFLTDHVRSEVTVHYPDQLVRLEAALASGDCEELSITSPEEVIAFAKLSEGGLGHGECSAIAACAIRGFHLALDDKQARKQAKHRFPNLVLISTEDLMVELIKAQLISIEEADGVKKQWEESYRFRLPFRSFRERFNP